MKSVFVLHVHLPVSAIQIKFRLESFESLILIFRMLYMHPLLSVAQSVNVRTEGGCTVLFCFLFLFSYWCLRCFEKSDGMRYNGVLCEMSETSYLQEKEPNPKKVQVGKDQTCHKIRIDKKVQVGKDQEKAQSTKDSHSKNRGGKNQTNNQVLIP